jgi:hypothetical protein
VFFYDQLPVKGTSIDADVQRANYDRRHGGVADVMAIASEETCCRFGHSPTGKFRLLSDNKGHHAHHSPSSTTTGRSALDLVANASTCTAYEASVQP